MELSEITATIKSFRNRAEKSVTNSEKRILYSDCELFLIKLEAIKDASKEIEQSKAALSEISGAITLSYVDRKHSLPMQFINKIDEFIRLMGVWMILAFSSVFLAIPCIILSPVDFFLVNAGFMTVYSQISVQVKLFLARAILHCSGINVVVRGLKRESFGKECVLACFSHGSSMDAFLLTGVIPVQALTVVSLRRSQIPHHYSAILKLISYIIVCFLFLLVQVGAFPHSLFLLAYQCFRWCACQQRQPRASCKVHGGRRHGRQARRMHGHLP